MMSCQAEGREFPNLMATITACQSDATRQYRESRTSEALASPTSPMGTHRPWPQIECVVYVLKTSGTENLASPLTPVSCLLEKLIVSTRYSRERIVVCRRNSIIDGGVYATYTELWFRTVCRVS